MPKKVKSKLESKRKSQLPAFVVLGAIKYQVDICDVPGNRLGEVLYGSGVIQVSDKIPYDQQVATLLHEVMHILFFANGDDDLGNNEGIVERTANALVLFLQKNKIDWKSE